MVGQVLKKIFAGPKMGHLGPKRGQIKVLGLFLADMHYFLIILHMMIENNNI